MNDDDSNAFVYKQPENDEEKAACEEALEACPVNAIGNDGWNGFFTKKAIGNSTDLDFKVDCDQATLNFLKFYGITEKYILLQ